MVWGNSWKVDSYSDDQQINLATKETKVYYN
jgi:hypothetical protein